MSRQVAGQSKIPVILFPGMGADATIFAQQLQTFPQLVVPEWTEPKLGEDLRAYCARISTQLDREVPCIVGGASFGGIVALEMTRQLNCVGCVLIGSIRRPEDLPKRISVFRPLKALIDFLPIYPIQCFAQGAAFGFGLLKCEMMSVICRQFAHANITLLRWSAKQLLDWKGQDCEVSVRQIHGGADFVFPVQCTQPDVIVSAAGHVLSMSHGEIVNEFLQGCLMDFDKSSGVTESLREDGSN